MSTKKSWVLGLLLAGGLSFAATAPVAMRVEVEPTRQAGALTEVVVVVQVSPEDRLRIGSNAILRIELDGGAVSSGSPMRAVRLEDDGSARVVVEWPPGEHHLRVEIEDQNPGAICGQGSCQVDRGSGLRTAPLLVDDGDGSHGIPPHG